MKKDPLSPVVSTDPRLATVRRVSKLMDEEFSIGKFRFGLDPILNFIPIAGDLAGYFVSAALILTMIQHGASGKLVVKMMANATLDALAGAVPVLGWVFDFAYKANTRNVKLLNEFYTQGKHTGSARPYIIPLLIFFLAVLALIIIGSIWLLKTFIGYIDIQISGT